MATVVLLGLSQAELEGRAEASKPFVPTAEWIGAARHHTRPKSLMQVFKQIWLGSYPRLHDQGAKTRNLSYRSYIQAYIQRDVQDVLRTSDHVGFNCFLAAVAGDHCRA